MFLYNLIKVGKITNSVGIKGELKIYPLTDYKERFKELKSVYIEDCNDKEYEIENVRYKNELVILKFKNVNDRNESEKLRNKFIFINKDKVRELPKDSYYIYDLIGLKVYSTNTEYLGKLTNVIQNSAQDLYELELEDNRKVLIPAVKEFIKEVNIKEGFIKVKIIEGLI